MDYELNPFSISTGKKKISGIRPERRKQA